MPRQLRIEYPGAICHVMSGGDRREDIFHDEEDRQEFLKTLAEACQKADFQLHAYCLMHNHFHLVVETPNGNLVAGMRWLLSSYTLRLNHRRKFFGQVFSGGRVSEARISGLDCWSGSSGKNCNVWVGRERTWKGASARPRRSWNWRHVCAGKRR
ncbi:MAG: transposase [Verrucomicrobiales bacterium]|nr:transposase [Verrucomicrobiales bacterium]